MYSYQTYGLNIYSEIQLPELYAGELAADVTIHVGPANLPASQTGQVERYLCGTPEEIYLYWRDIGTFLIRHGREVIIDPVPAVEERVLRSVIVGPALAVLLHQRGLSVFHASAVAFPQGAVAFMARKGHGKSTTAAALHMRDHDLVTDDILALDECNCGLMVQPGFPQLKLWPDSVEAVGEIPETLPQLRPTMEKRIRKISHTGLASEPLPLSCVFLLGGGQEFEITALDSKDALFKILPHWYGALFKGELLRLFGLDIQLNQCTNLIRHVPVVLLKGPPSLDALPHVAQIIEEYVEHSLSQDI